MRFKENKDGDTKIKKFFAIFPIKIDDETRWLEIVKVQYKFIHMQSHKLSYSGYWTYFNGIIKRWVKIKFINK